MGLLENTIKILFLPSLRKTSVHTHEQVCTGMSRDLHVPCWHHFKFINSGLVALTKVKFRKEILFAF